MPGGGGDRWLRGAAAVSVATVVLVLVLFTLTTRLSVALTGRLARPIHAVTGLSWRARRVSPKPVSGRRRSGIG